MNNTNNNIKTKSVPFWFSVSVFIILFLMIIIIVYRNMKDVLGGVTIDAKIEQSEDISTNNLFNIKGNAEHAAFITINGREIFIEKNGNFNEYIALPDGYSVVTFFARNKFGKDTEKTMKVYTSNGDIVAYEYKNNY